MKRKKFLQLTLLGFFSYTNVFATKIYGFKNIQNSWLTNFIKAINAEKKSIRSLTKQQILAIQNATLSFKQSNYQFLNVFYKTESQILVPIALENYPANLFDINLLCFDLSEDQLKLQTILSAFDLELIATQSIQNQVLPINIVKDLRKFRENVSLKVTIQSNKTLVEVNYFTQSNESKKIKYISNHCLFNS